SPSLTYPLSCLTPLHPTTPRFTLSLHDALPISRRSGGRGGGLRSMGERLVLPQVRRCIPGEVEHVFPDHIVRLAGHIEDDRSGRSEEHTSELQSRFDLVCRLLLEKKNRPNGQYY